MPMGTSFLLVALLLVWFVYGTVALGDRLSMDKRYTSCGDKMCKCDNTTAICKNHGRNLSYIPRLPSGIVNLYFSNNSLTNVTKRTFCNVYVASVSDLSLVNNGISSISHDAFADFVALKVLWLDQNKDLNKTQLTKSFASIKTPYLLAMHLSNIGLVELYNDFFANLAFSNITELDLSDNDINTVNWVAFQNLTRLTTLKLMKNGIRKISTDIGHPGITDLQLDENEIGRNFPRFCSLQNTSLFPNLQKLNLMNNFISSLTADSMKCLETLRILNLNGNSLRILRNNAFSTLPSLQQLHIAHMCGSLSRLEPYALNNSNIDYLNFRENELVFHPKRDSRMFQLLTNLKTLDISLNNLKKLSYEDIMTLLGDLKLLIKLTATRTGLHSLPGDLLKSLNHLIQINLDGNGFSKFPYMFNTVGKLRVISLQGNKIRVLRKSSFSDKFLNSVETLNLAANPFSCTCENLWFRSAIDKKGKIGNTSLQSWPVLYECASPEDLKHSSFKDYHPTDSSCNSKNYFIIATVLLASVVLVSTGIMGLVYRYRWYIKYWLYKLKSQTRDNEAEPLLEPNFDAFVIYNQSDSQFVHDDIQHLLETGHAYKLHLWERDARGGRNIFKEMIDGIEGSHNAIAVVSRDSLDDGWFQFQLNIALGRQVELKRAFLILVVLDNVEYEKLSKFWCVMLTRLPTARWCNDKTNVRRSVFEQQMLSHLEKDK